MTRTNYELLARFTTTARGLLAVTVAVAQKRDRAGHPTADDLLDALAWMYTTPCIAIEVLKQHGVFINRIRPDVILTNLRWTPKTAELGAELLALMQLACDQAEQLGHDWCGTEHLLLAILASPDSSAASALREHGVTFENFRSKTMELFAAGVRPMTGEFRAGAK